MHDIMLNKLGWGGVRTLFMRLALSTVIFRPMLQLGCLVASATVTVFSFSTGHSLKAPPLAVRMMRLNPPGGRPCPHGIYVRTSVLLSASGGPPFLPTLLSYGNPPPHRFTFQAF
jgi:hypothetical protein